MRELEINGAREQGAREQKRKRERESEQVNECENERPRYERAR
jgi:hypothetical protein